MKRQGLFTGFWTDLEGRRLRRVRRNEFGELYRLWARHADIRLGVRLLGTRQAKP